MNLVEKFMAATIKLEPQEFVGLAHLLCVPLLNVDKQPRPFEAIWADMIERFIKLRRGKQRELLKIVRAATIRGKINETKDTTAE